MSKPSAFVRIPKERVGVLVGPEGKVKQYIEEKLTVGLQIESEAGGVTITMAENATDPSLLLKAKDVVTAIGRGFSPEHAFRLIRNEDAVLDVIDLRIIFGRSESDIKRVKGRIIGMNGKTRRLIEELTDANVAVYGHTVGIIGTFEQADAARNAVQMLIEGSQHHNVYKFLQKKRSELKKQMLELWEKPEEKK
ncbi:MAG TPA: KH domain-containing protein [Candidatus Bathyarchaeia archaeon]|nr:KH domain-containing protein [Candidatus Bathyarchaeia archaeon]